MAGSRKDVRVRLQRAALELYSERGFDRTTAADVAALADVTERTYFRHFPDKREVLFDGEAAMTRAVADAVANAPAGLAPLPTLLDAFLSIAPMFTEHDRELSERRHRVISATPELKERELAKIAHVTDAITTALEHRDVPPHIAPLAAMCGIAVLTRARLEWLAGDTRDYPTLLADAFADLASLVDPSTGQGFSPIRRS
ncbi:TetR/AcrR family transcriptional regulator [Streptomyces sp. NPDC050485]|uniref:TetR/AcrR family transcriptional regulator n=1 Tax=Streptomyces sp. NPDC050485 TaxID=3365617 RepID=UPI0037B5FD00